MNHKHDETSYINTGQGKLYLNPPDAHNIREVLPIELVARALSRECRFSGLIPNFYSVAEHSYLMSYLCVDPFQGLMHDAAECVIRDQPSPWKHGACEQELNRVREFEAAFAKAFNVRYPNSVGTHIQDVRLCGGLEIMLYTSRPEMEYKTSSGRYVRRLLGVRGTLAEQLFLDRYYKLRGAANV